MSEAVVIALAGQRAEMWDLEQVYAEHGAYVHTLVKRLLGPCGDAEDLTQEVFLVALRKLPRFAGASPRSWLTQIALKLVRNARRTFWLRRTLGLGMHSELADWRTPERAASARETTRAVYWALDGLAEKKRTVFVLFEIQGLGCAEIAEVLGCPLATVYTRLHHARREFTARFPAGAAALGAQDDDE